MLQDRLLDGRLKIRHLTMVVTVAQTGTVIAAAKQLNITQPVVTRALHEVEEILGVSLFDRGPKGVTLTAYGETFLLHARSVLAQLRSAGNQIELMTRAELGTVTVGTHLAGSNLLLPQAIALVKETQPLLTIVVREATPDVLLAGLQAGEIDLVVGRLVAEPAAGVTQERLYMEPISIVARKGHRVHELGDVTLHDLAKHPWVLPVDQTSLRTELEEAFLAEGVPLPDDRVECTSILTLRQLLLVTDALAALPMLIGREDPELELVRVPLPSIRRSVGVSFPRSHPLSPGAAALLEAMGRVAGELRATLP